ncbi:MAG: hypothetical protein JWR26_3106 [Pedosphaera sp.]|nr:hypothetical protein [Pedosphaera sp.]
MTGRSAAFGLFCNPESRRVEGFCNALAQELRQRPILVPWQSVLEGHPWQARLGATPTLLRLESPGRNWSVEKGLLARGATIQDEEANQNWRGISPDAVASLTNEPGRVHPMRQWFLGWRETLRELELWVQQVRPLSRWLCPPADVTRMFDKAASHHAMEVAGISVPPMIGMPHNFDDLREMMRGSGRRRVFIKPCHGSSASGVIALESSRSGLQAFSTLALVEGANELTLQNQRSIRTYRGADEVRKLVDAACRERCIVQAWIPKAGISGRPFDLRVVVIGGRARNVMVRLGRGPMTNSQLLGGKGDVNALRKRMGIEAWEQMLGLCELTMQKCFPKSLYAGLDVLIEPNFKTSWILEINAFGDLLPRVLHEGRDTYSWEVLTAMQPPQRHHVSATGL